MRLLLFVGVLLGGSAWAGGPTITELPYFAQGNTVVIDRALVSDDGLRAVAVTDSPGGLNRLQWELTVSWILFTPPGVPASLLPSALGGDGQTLGYSGMLKSLNSVAIAVPSMPGGVWHGASGFTPLGGDVSVTGLSFDGAVRVGDSLDPGTLVTLATQWSGLGVQDMLTSESSFTAVSADGSTAFGLFTEPGGSRFTTIKRVAGMSTMLTAFEFEPTYIADCNHNGTIAVGQRFGNTNATDATPVRFDGAIEQTLPMDPVRYDDYWVHAVSDSGELVVGQGQLLGSGNDEAIVWKNSTTLMTLENLMLSEGMDLTGWTLWRATDISPDGRFIIGSGQLAGENACFLIERSGAAGISLCHGDGGDQQGCTDCPCGNNSAPGTIGGCINSAGTATSIAATGSTSVSLPTGSAGDLRFSLTGAPAAAFCVLLSGSGVAPLNMASPCFGTDSGTPAMDRDGLRCAVQAVQRHGGRSANASGEVSNSAGPDRVWGGEAQPLDGLAAQGGFASGQTRVFQVTHREDPLRVCMRGLNTSQAVEIAFTP